MTALDTFDRAVGRPLRELPQPVAGKPSRIRPSGARRDLACGRDAGPGGRLRRATWIHLQIHGDKNIHRAVSLVPQEVFNFFDLDVELYLRDEEIRDFKNEYRAINHAQIELIAARASAINACFY